MSKHIRPYWNFQSLPRFSQFDMRFPIEQSEKVKILALSFLVAAGLAFSMFDTSSTYARDDELKRFEVAKKLMGVKFGFVVYAKDIEQARKGIIAVFERISELEDCMSDYDPDSELSKVCTNAKPGVPQKISAELFEVLEISNEINRLSDGSFDPTIGPLSKLWRIARATKKVPEEKTVKESMSCVGWRHIKLNSDDQTITMAKPGIQLDLGGVAKGYAADEAIRVFRKHGLPICLVDASGDVTVGDAPPNKKGWLIAISVEEGKRVTLSNGSVASSGDRYQNLEKNGKRYSHIIDPKTGWGMTDQRFVTVVTSKTKRPGAMADAMASALSVIQLDDIQLRVKKMKSDGIKVEQKKDQSQMTIVATGLLKE